MFSIVSTGPSSVAINLTYDRKRLTEALDKISGAGLKPNDILDTPVGAQGPPEVRYRAHVSFDTAYEILGYYSSNPDPTIRKRKIEVKVNRPNLELRYRTEYTLKPTKAPAPRPKTTSPPK
jgi:tRNA/tmRNA/rRNA uracil-C5-methylase (TrmA/RlmC/RlmD family)